MAKKILRRQNPKLIVGGLAVDDRGKLQFVNEFDFAGVKRFYQVENFSTEMIRAWHGHMKEGKYVYVAKGSAIVAAVKMTDKKKPSKDEEVNHYVLSGHKPAVLFIPPGYANGFKALEANTIIQFFSTSSLEESANDDFRFDWDYWGKEVWQVENR